jgi:hypothetical protein
MSSRARDIPGLPPGDPSINPDVRNAIEALRREVRRLIGAVGSGGDAALTINNGGSSGGGGTTVVVGGGSGGGSEEPDLTPPPTVTGLQAVAGLTTIIVTTDTPTYTVGHGPGSTRIYAAKRNPSDPGAVFGDATLAAERYGPINILDLPSDINVRWHIWAKWVSADGVESVNPAGGTNGVVVQTGKIGNSELGPAVVLATNIASGAVTADKTLFDIGGENLLGNNSFEVDDNADGIADGWQVYNNDNAAVPTTGSLVAGRIIGRAARVSWTGTNLSTKGMYASAGLNGTTYGVRGGWKPGATYVVSFYARSLTAEAVPMRLYWNQAPATTVTVKAPNLTTGWQRYAYRITWGGSVEANGQLFISVLNGAAISSSWIEIDDVQVEEGDQLSGYFGKLATGTIVAGDGAIANLAIVNTQIANATITDAKIANVSVSKLTAGSIAVGEYIQSNNYSAGVAGWRIHGNGVAEFAAASIRGQLGAAQIDTRGLDVLADDGAVILSAGASLAGSTINFPSTINNVPLGWRNDQITISGGVLSGIGSGSGTVVANNVLSYGANRVYNADFANGLYGWDYTGGSGISEQSAGYDLTSWFPIGGHALWSRQAGVGGNANFYYERMSNPIPVVVGRRYVVSAYTGAHRCQVGVFFYVYDAAGNAFSNSYANGDPNNDAAASGGQALSGYKRCYSYLDIPAGATHVRVVLRKYDTVAGQPDSYMFVANAQLEEVGAAATAPGPFAVAPLDTTTVRAANPITSLNVGTYIASAAIGGAYIGTLLASNIQTSVLSTVMNGGASFGIRMEANKLQVYDENNVRRVLLGNLS